MFFQILFLREREQESETATLLTSAGGFIQAWSIHSGELLGQFQASIATGESVHGMTTDSNNKILVTGDSMGYITVSLLNPSENIYYLIINTGPVK